MPSPKRARAPREVYLNSREVMDRYGTSPMWLWRRVRDGSGFPQPLVVAARRYWRLSQIIEWERSNVRASVGGRHHAAEARKAKVAARKAAAAGGAVP